MIRCGAKAKKYRSRLCELKTVQSMTLLLLLFTGTAAIRSSKATPLIPDPSTLLVPEVQAGAGEGFVIQDLQRDSESDSSTFSAQLGPRVKASSDGSVLHVISYLWPNFVGDDLTYRPAALYYYRYENGVWSEAETVFTINEDLLTDEYDLRQLEVSYALDLDTSDEPQILFGYWQWYDGGGIKRRLSPVVYRLNRNNGIWLSTTGSVTNLMGIGPIRSLDFALDQQDMAHVVAWRENSDVVYTMEPFSTFPTRVHPGDFVLKSEIEPILEIDKSDLPRVVYKCNKRICYSYTQDSNTWTTDVALDCSALGADNVPFCSLGIGASLDFDSDNRPHVSSSAYIGGDTQLLYMYLDVGSSSWNWQFVGSHQGTNFFTTDLVLTDTDTVGILWCQRTDYPRTNAHSLLLSEKVAGSSSWQNQVIMHGSSLGALAGSALVYSGEEPVSVFTAGPVYMSLDVPGTQAAGWTNRISPPHYRYPFQGVGLVAAFPWTQDEMIANDSSYVMLASYDSLLYIMEFDDGLFETRWSLGVDYPDTMLPLLLSHVSDFSALTLGDFDNDGLTDLVVVGRQTGTTDNIVLEFQRRSIDYNLFDSHIKEPAEFIDQRDGAFQDIWDMATADFNLDGNMDFLLGGETAAAEPVVYLYLGNGDGSFQSPLPVSSSLAIRGLDTEDLNVDGIPDFCVAGNFYTWRLQCFLGNSDGTFTPVLNEFDHVSPRDEYRTIQGVSLSDFDNDGFPDAVLTNYAGSKTNINGLAFYKGRGDGTFHSTPVTSGPELGVSTTGDFKSRALDNDYFNDDEHMDLLVLDTETRNVYLFLGNGDGTFEHNSVGFSHYLGATGGGVTTLLDPDLVECRDEIYLPSISTMRALSTKPYSSLVQPTAEGSAIANVARCDFSDAPSAAPSTTSEMPSVTPSTVPSGVPSTVPSTSPSTAPSAQPSSVPSLTPSTDPSGAPSTEPSLSPSASPSTTLDLVFHIIGRLRAALASLEPASFARPSESETLSNNLLWRLNRAEDHVQKGNYQSAANALEAMHAKYNGCGVTNNASPDNNDWVASCGDQEILASYTLEAIDVLDRLW